MKILRIKLRNLNSLRGDHEVNFEAEPLAGAGLFAITGPTGAGKSTLLDAITLALYGKAARYGTVPSPEDMMSRHCGECLAEVLFQVPSGTYRAEWQLHRSRAKADGKVQPPKRFVYDSLGQPLTQNVRDTEAKIEELVGLDYPRFLRSALLAQGEFAQFLKAKPDERAGLLESLTGTSIYSELGALAHIETVKRENDLALKQAAIQQIQLLTEDQRQKLIADLPKEESRFGNIKQDLAQAANLLNKATNLADSLERERKALAEQKILTAQLKSAEADIQRLSRHRLTIPFHGDLASLQAAENAVATMQTLLSQAAVEQSQANSNARNCLLGFRRMAGEQIEKTKTEINTCKERIRKAAERKAAAEKGLDQHQGDKELPERLADLVSDLAALKSARRDLDREWTQIRRLAMKLEPAAAEALCESPEKITKTEAKKILARLNEQQQQKHTAAASACKTAEAELKLAEDHLSKARLVADFEQHRAGLKPGEPCPLCGAKAHPYAEGAEPSFPFKDLEGRVEKARETCKVRQKELDDLCQLQAELKNNGQVLQSAVGNFHEVLARLAQELAGLLVLVPAPGKEDETKSILQQRASDYRKQSAEKETAEREHAAAEGDQNRLAAALSTLEDKQSVLALESLPQEPEDDADKTLPRWTSIAAADVAWSAAKNDLTSKTTTFSNRQKDKDRLVRDFTGVESRLLTGLAGSAFADIAGLKTARMEPATALQIEKLEHDLKNRSHAIEADLRATRQSIDQCRAEAAPEGDALVQLKERHRTLQNDHDQLIRDLNTWRTQLAQDDANRQSVAAKQKELETERGRLEIWRRLRGLIGSHDGRMFRRYAQTLSLDVLVRFANRHLLRLSDRYRLRRRAGEELDLEIEDFHQAGAVRPMASLSGGESFLASLALALGLSDLAGRNVRIDSLFIDEGLSSLDSETLDLALSALETLRQDTKTVGVISHVDLLKERIATQIVVEKQSGGTSSLRIVS